MSLLQKIFGPKEDPAKDAMRPLYAKIVEKARALHWYEEGAVTDSLDGRFEMVTAMLSLVLIRLDNAADKADESVLLTEIFVDDMDGQLREVGVGDMIVGKHLGKMMAAMGGRLGAYREGLKDKSILREAVLRNVFRGEAPDAEALDHVVSSLAAEMAKLSVLESAQIASGAADW
jgi:cytochrome b pre-mRNA-processing protein 3